MGGKDPSFLKNLTSYFREFTENSSLHGVKYLGQKRSLIERALWLVIIVISIFVCTAFIIKAYNKWDNSPAIVSFSQSPTPIWQIPFPAITICPQIKARQSILNITDLYHKILINEENYTMEELNNFARASLLCDNHIYKQGNKTTPYDTIDYFQEIAQDFNEIFWTCVWTNTNNSCTNLFIPILTAEGICYTFNMLDRDDIFKNEVYNNRDYLSNAMSRNGWTLENGYRDTPFNESYPKRSMSSGVDGGMFILMRAYEKDLDYICRGPVQGFKILLHHPGEIPKVATNYFRTPLDEEMIVSVKPKMMTTSENLRDFEPHKRHCYFDSERYLRFYKNYTQQNCEMECLTNFTLNRCDCVSFHMPYNESTPICGSGSNECVFEAKQELLLSQATSGVDALDKKNNKRSEHDCDCLPACTTLTYNAETSQVDFDWKSVFKAYKVDPSEFPGVKMSRVTIFFKEMQFIVSERNELYGITDFLATCGGLLALFIGFSFISAIEPIYFLTLRLLCNMKKHGKRYWSGPPN